MLTNQILKLRPPGTGNVFRFSDDSPLVPRLSISPPAIEVQPGNGEIGVASVESCCGWFVGIGVGIERWVP